MEHVLKKSNAVDFNALSSMDDQYSSSSDDPFEILGEHDYFPPKSESQEFTIDLTTIFMNYSIPRNIPNYPPEPFKISDSEYYLENFNSLKTPVIPMRIEPIECVLVNAAHLEQFPKPSSAYSAKKPQVFAWFDAQTAFSSEYQTTMQSYFKNNYNCIRNHLRFFFSIAPSYERLQNMASIRREVPAGRILFHYVGYGFPKITENNIWCSERRSTNFVPFELDQLFAKLSPPTWFIFDCSNAGVVIPAFLKAAEKQPKSVCTDWGNWFCVCATSKGEDLPNDPRLPRDFLTSTILTSIKMAVICHILQHYRVSLVCPNFPLELPCQNLFNEKSPDVARLSLTLTSITDAIAADSLPMELYHKTFRSDRLSAVIFRHFLLAQFLLRPYRVHPISYPAIPDLSTHRLWKQWEVCVDVAICSVNIPRPSFATDLYSRLLKSFETILKNDQLHLIRPYHLTLLFHMLFNEPQNDMPLFLLAEYSSSPKSSPEMLTTVALFGTLFFKLIRTPRESPSFHPLCFLVLALLYYNPAFSTEIRKELDISAFPEYIFDKKLKESTRILVTALLATLVVSHDGFQQICTSFDFLKKVRLELETASSKRVQWLLLLVRRLFHLFSPEPSVFVSNGLHVQAGLFITQRDPLTRAAAIGALTSFLRPFECYVNVQLLLMCIPLFNDPSYLVRFHFLLMLKKFIISFDCYSDLLTPRSISLPMDSYQSILNFIFKCDNFQQSNIFTYIDDLVSCNNFMLHIYLVVLEIIKIYCDDQHPSISLISRSILDFVQKQREINNMLKMRRRSQQEIIDDIDFEQIGIPNLDQNESLHRIILHNLIFSNIWKQDSKSVEKVFESNETNINIDNDFQIESNLILSHDYDSIELLCFHPILQSYSFKDSEYVYYIDEQNNQFSIKCENVFYLTIAYWNNQTKIVVATTDGFINVWEPTHKIMCISYRCSLTKPLVSIDKENDFIVYSINQYNILSKWNLEDKSLVKEFKIPLDTQIISFDVNKKMILVDSNNDIYDIKILDKINITKIKKMNSNKIIRISNTRDLMFLDEKGDYYTVTNNKSILVKKDIFDFGNHPIYPFIIFSPNNSSSYITDLQFNTVYEIKLSINSFITIHPKLPYFALSDSKGHIQIFNI